METPVDPIRSDLPPAIKAIHLKKTFENNEYVLNDLSLDIPRGKITVLIGFSGTGKSVLLKTILGLIQPTEGWVEVLGQNISEMPERQQAILRRRCGVLFQNAALFDDMSALENVCFPLFEHRRDLRRNAVLDIAKARLKLVGLVEKDFHKLPGQLSGGMKKRVGLARAIALDPEILFYDEPTTGLDPIMTEMVDNLIVDTHRHKEGLTSVVVTHDLYAAFRIGDFVAMLDKGQILLHGTPKDFLESEIDLVKRFVQKGVRKA